MSAISALPVTGVADRNELGLLARTNPSNRMNRRAESGTGSLVLCGGFPTIPRKSDSVQFEPTRHASEFQT
jgi:hypothetical protein